MKKKMPECRCDVLVVTPPLVQMNAPYPAAACLCGHLARVGLVAAQADLSLALALRVFSPEGLRRVTDAIRARRLRAPTAAVSHLLRHAAEYHGTIGPVIRFLQGRDSTLASRIASRRLLPEGPRFAILDAADAHAPETLAARDDAAKYLAGLYLDDLADAIRDGLDPWFGFARYADHLASAQPTFDPLARAVADDASLIGGMIDTLAEESLARHQPRVVAITAPFPGTVYGAFRIARHIRRVCPDVTLVLGGGYVNTEMRELDDPRVFDF
ncbi:MAG: radical SAM protein, partial [Lentisphaerota bacterium]